ncbi:MAG: heparan-alpha-glucosaminide N-acetyltransferase [Acidobacteriaceae bacterium]|jgi:heparan-alpha-glucosaminide N-acetyltransferase|nr:heparan-alpha-glucosaminide N-acetyltransferase [Acidobacteriaceae bacterium]
MNSTVAESADAPIAQASAQAPTTTTVVAPRRNVAVDAYRGLVMLLMMGEVMQWAAVSHAYPGSSFWRVLAFNQSHVEWAGMSLHDTIQPSFTFLVGVAMPYSIASRIRKGESFVRMLPHTLWRALLLIALGIFLRSTHSAMTYYTFEDTLTQIGLGYPIAFLLAFARPRWQWTALAVILVGYWAAWALYPAPGPGFNYAAVGVPPDWHHNFTGFLSHWNKNSNLGQAFDVWFLNLFPREHPFLFNDGGYLTLSFIPTLGTMLLGLAAGRWLRAAEPAIPMRRFLQTGAILIAAALLLHFGHICPIVKRIWTPAWTLFSGGVCFLFLAAFSWVIEVKNRRGWAFPLAVVGMNSIAAYLIAHLWEDFIISSFHIHLGQRPFTILGPGLQPLLLGIAVMLTYWLVLYWMYKRKLFLRI